MESEKYLYFAYGSNMNFKQMRKRCPDHRFISKGYLKGYKLVFDDSSQKWGGAVANVIESDGSTVEDGIFEISESDLEKLDRYEGYPSCYDREKLTVRDDKNNSFQAYVYKRTGKKIGKPSDFYRNVIIEGAKDCGLSHRYIEEKILKIVSQ